MNQVNVDIIKEFKSISEIESVAINLKLHIIVYLEIPFRVLHSSNVKTYVRRKKQELMDKYPDIILEIEYKIKK